MVKKQLLHLRLVRSPLSRNQKLSLLAEYNRLSSNDIRLQNFERWTEQSPEGPAAHALLENDEKVIVGHCCVFPFPMQYAGRRVTVAKAEYLFISEEFRKQPVSGFENSIKPAALLLLDELYQFCSNIGWIPILSSAPKGVQSLHRLAGCQPVNFALHECLFILRPRRAFKLTPGLSEGRRVILFLAGTGQRAIAPMVAANGGGAQAIRNVPIDSAVREQWDEDPNAISFPCSPEFLRWHYPEAEYSRLELDSGSQGFVIAKKKSEIGYFRVCQTQLKSPAKVRELGREMIRLARIQKATGVRWSVYGEGEASRQVLSELRKLGFVCVPRTRNLMIYTREPEFAAPQKWAFCDSFFAFDY